LGPQPPLYRSLLQEAGVPPDAAGLRQSVIDQFRQIAATGTNEAARQEARAISIVLESNTVPLRFNTSASVPAAGQYDLVTRMATTNIERIAQSEPVDYLQALRGNIAHEVGGHSLNGADARLWMENPNAPIMKAWAEAGVEPVYGVTKPYNALEEVNSFWNQWRYGDPTLGNKYPTGAYASESEAREWIMNYVARKTEQEGGAYSAAEIKKLNDNLLRLIDEKDFYTKTFPAGSNQAVSENVQALREARAAQAAEAAERLPIVAAVESSASRGVVERALAREAVELGAAAEKGAARRFAETVLGAARRYFPGQVLKEVLLPGLLELAEPIGTVLLVKDVAEMAANAAAWAGRQLGNLIAKPLEDAFKQLDALNAEDPAQQRKRRRAAGDRLVGPSGDALIGGLLFDASYPADQTAAAQNGQAQGGTAATGPQGSNGNGARGNGAGTPAATPPNSNSSSGSSTPRFPTDTPLGGTADGSSSVAPPNTSTSPTGAPSAPVPPSSSNGQVPPGPPSAPSQQGAGGTSPPSSNSPPSGTSTATASQPPSQAQSSPTSPTGQPAASQPPSSQPTATPSIQGPSGTNQPRGGQPTPSSGASRQTPPANAAPGSATASPQPPLRSSGGDRSSGADTSGTVDTSGTDVSGRIPDSGPSVPSRSGGRGFIGALNNIGTQIDESGGTGGNDSGGGLALPRPRWTTPPGGQMPQPQPATAAPQPSPPPFPAQPQPQQPPQTGSSGPNADGGATANPPSDDGLPASSLPAPSPPSLKQGPTSVASNDNSGTGAASNQPPPPSPTTQPPAPPPPSSSPNSPGGFSGPPRQGDTWKPPPPGTNAQPQPDTSGGGGLWDKATRALDGIIKSIGKALFGE
jgi:hypothetical protein